jgi:hypothetical protein
MYIKIREFLLLSSSWNMRDKELHNVVKIITYNVQTGIRKGNHYKSFDKFNFIKNFVCTFI